MRRTRRIPHGGIALILLATLAVTPAAAVAPAPGVATSQAGDIAGGIARQAKGAVRRFYAARGFRPLWLKDGRPGRAAGLLADHLMNAAADGLKPTRYKVGELRGTIDAARGGDPAAAVRAELMLSERFARYVRDQRARPRARMIYADAKLKPRRPDMETVLRAAAFAKSLDSYVADMGWMSPHYARLRGYMLRMAKEGATPEARARLRLNLERARLLPGPAVHHVVVDASSGQLWYYGDGRQAGTMRVVVGTPQTPTPMMAAMLNWAILNPYWNVPDSLVRTSIARKVMGGRTLAMMKIEALSDWSDSPRKIPASAIDWPAVAAGQQTVRLRELPGPGNSMGRVKFLMPNEEGIYLHDTPDRDLLAKPDRHFSNGCIRLEKAAELGRWLLQQPLRPDPKRPEQAVPLPVPVPVYLTYLTPLSTERGIVFREDVYGRDGL
jgi:murein L,D-transpeptidase YcbB/YkuD